MTLTNRLPPPHQLRHPAGRRPQRPAGQAFPARSAGLQPRPGSNSPQSTGRWWEWAAPIF